MLNIPVKLYLTACASRVEFNMINSDTGNRVSQVLVDAVNRTIVEREDIVKGYEHSKGNYVTFTDEEIDALQVEQTNTVPMYEFVPVNFVNPLHVEKSYYLTPDDQAERSYALLTSILRKTNKAAVGKWISRGKEHLIIIVATEDGLLMHQMYYVSEIRCVEARPEVELSDSEVALGCELIKVLSKDGFNHAAYRDTFADKVAQAADDKIKQGDIINPGKNTAATTNLKDALVSSITSVEKATKAKRPSRAKKTAIG
jgi:DNA end-binding protein Ku